MTLKHVFKSELFHIDVHKTCEERPNAKQCKSIQTYPTGPIRLILQVA